MAMQKEGTSVQDARDKIWLVDSKGLIVKDRPEGGVTGHKTRYAKNHPPVKTLGEVVKKIKPSVIIGKFFIISSLMHKIAYFSIFKDIGLSSIVRD